MPIFEYLCQNCGTAFEKLVRAGTEVECPNCGEQKPRQQLSTFAARSGRSAEPAPAPGGCPAGMCQNPGFCGRN